MIMDLGPNAAYIIASYALVVLVVGGLIAGLVHDGRRNEQRLVELESRGVKRRSAA